MTDAVSHLYERFIVFIKGFWHSRGFGVQSPFAYSFIINVIKGHSYNNSFNSIEEPIPDINNKTLKLCRLYFRIASFCEPNIILNFNSYNNAYKIYMQYACNSAEFIDINKDKPLDINECLFDSGTCMVLMSMIGDYKKDFYNLLAKTSTKTVLILQEINKNKDTRNFWKKLLLDDRIHVTFDLYYVGIIFLNDKLYKHNYIVNF